MTLSKVGANLLDTLRASAHTPDAVVGVGICASLSCEFP